MKITIEDYQTNWINKFLSEKETIVRVLKNFSPVIEHIGSTSVPGLGAKPVIDILAGLKDEAELDNVIRPMLDKKYTYFKKYDIVMPYRRLFSKLKSLYGQIIPSILDINQKLNTKEFIVETNIHIIVKDTYHWKRMIAFRDYLRTYPDIREEYFQHKKEISQREFKDVLEYNNAKNDFIKKTEQIALTWYDLEMSNSSSH